MVDVHQVKLVKMRVSYMPNPSSNLRLYETLGSDSFNFAFVKKFWYLLKDKVRIMCNQFHGNEVLPKALLSYFVALIP